MDWKWTVTTTLPVLTLVLGALLGQWQASRLEQAQLRRALKMREAERKQARADRREQFELSHLGDLHGALMELQKAALIYKADFEAGGAESLAEASATLTRAKEKVKSLAGFVLDGHTSELVRLAHDKTIESAMRTAAGGDASMATMIQARIHISRAQSAIGQRIREIYRSEGLPVAEPPDEITAGQ